MTQRLGVEIKKKKQHKKKSRQSCNYALRLTASDFCPLLTVAEAGVEISVRCHSVISVK